MVGPVRGLARWARRLGRDRARRASSARSIAYRAGASVLVLLDAVAPGLLLAQAIGRIGNWWNQELFGKPTDLPWGLEIDPSTVPRRTSLDATFHPTFLYELLWNLLAVGVLLLVERRCRLTAAGALRALRRALLLRPLLDRAAARRPVARAARAAAERVGLVVRLRRSRSRSSSGGSSSHGGRRAARRAASAASGGRRWPCRAAASGRAASLPAR